MRRFTIAPQTPTRRVIQPPQAVTPRLAINPPRAPLAPPRLAIQPRTQARAAIQPRAPNVTLTEATWPETVYGINPNASKEDWYRIIVVKRVDDTIQNFKFFEVSSEMDYKVRNRLAGVTEEVAEEVIRRVCSRPNGAIWAKAYGT